MASTPSLNSLLQQLVSVTTISEIRYEGRLYSYDTANFTITLKNVRNMGTENRVASVRVNPTSKPFDFIVFDGNHIRKFYPINKNSRVDDPAIVSAITDQPGSVASNHKSQFMRMFDNSRNAGRARTVDIEHMMGGSSGNQRNGANKRRPTGSGAETSSRSGSTTASSARTRGSNKPASAGGKKDSKGVRHVSFSGDDAAIASILKSSSDDRRGRMVHIPHVKPANSQNRRRGGRPVRQRGKDENVPGSWKPAKEPVKMCDDFDFDKAQEAFEELSVNDKRQSSDRQQDQDGDDGAGEIKECYNKEKSFFDNLSTGAEKETPRRSRKEEVKANKETFGLVRLPRRRRFSNAGRSHNQRRRVAAH